MKRFGTESARIDRREFLSTCAVGAIGAVLARPSGMALAAEATPAPTAPLAIRYLLVGLVMNFVSGWSTDFITRWVEKQQGVTLKTELPHH